MNDHDHQRQAADDERPTTEQLLRQAARLAREVADHFERLARLRGGR
ncbi:hypothetical protein [Streptomyces capparidis]